MTDLSITLRPTAAGHSPEMAEAPLVPRPEEVTLTICGETRRVRAGTPVLDVLPPCIGERVVVAALLGRRPVSLTACVTWDTTIEPIFLDSMEGQRIHRMSQALLLLEAAARIAPEAELRLAHSVGFGRRVLVGLGWRQRLGELAGLLEVTMASLVEQDLPLIETWAGVTEAMEYFRRHKWHDTVDLLATWRDQVVPLVSYGSVHAIVMSALEPSTRFVAGARVLEDHGGLLLLYGQAAKSRDSGAELGCGALPVATVEDAELGASDLVTEKEALAVSRQTLSMTQQQERWLETLSIRSVGAFNQACISGHVGELINVSEGFHEKRISRIADEVHGRGKNGRIVCIAGPSSSGKTTFIKRLRVQLQVLGINPIAISLDDYYCDREDTPRDERGEFDFESLHALRLPLLNEHLERLLRGDAVKTAHYDFLTGKSHGEGGPEIKLDHKSVLMLEGIHGLNPELLGSISESEVFRVFICPLAQLPFDRVTRVHASDVRLIRRMVRDRHTRGYNAAETIRRWESVRAGERKHIFPFQHHADAVFDSSLIYEVPVLKVFAERYLFEVKEEHASWPTAWRLLKLVDRFITLQPDKVPPTSILREFVGGSAFQY